MTETPKHTKITLYEELPDGSISAVTESYFEELASRKSDIIAKVKTDRSTFLSDVISCLDVISKQQAKELHLTISVDEWNQPNLIIKQYTIRKENFKRR
jgi:hypothetical protein